MFCVARFEERVFLKLADLEAKIDNLTRSAQAIWAPSDPLQLPEGITFPLGSAQSLQELETFLENEEFFKKLVSASISQAVKSFYMLAYDIKLENFF